MDDHTATSKGVHGCSVCTMVVPAGTHTCPRCGTSVHPRGPATIAWNTSLQKTWAWLITSVLLYIPANALPIMYTNRLGNPKGSTIIGGVVTLWHHGSYPIATIIFIASVLVPVGKILILVWLCLSFQLGWSASVQRKTEFYRLTELVGRWSMVDVFVVGVLVALIQFGALMSIVPGPAALAFAGMVSTTMLAAGSFDPRLLWAIREPPSRKP